MIRPKWGLIGALFFVAWIGFQNPANASTLASETSRIAGSRQIDTAIEVSRNGWKSAETDTVILANCDNFPDALVAAPLSHKLMRPFYLLRLGEWTPVSWRKLSGWARKRLSS